MRYSDNKDGLNVTPGQLLDESLLACNCILSVHGTSPYEALFGRVPPLLRDLHGEHSTALDDISGGATSKHIHRLRELSLQNIIQGHAEERLRIASTTKTRPAVQSLDLKPGDLVEFYRDPPGKDVSGWRGPGPVVSIDRADEGLIEVRWQSRVIPWYDVLSQAEVFYHNQQTAYHNQRTKTCLITTNRKALHHHCINECIKLM